MSQTMMNLSEAQKEISRSSDKAKKAIIRLSRDIKPVTPSQLWLYIRAHMRVALPHKPCCQGHSTPFHMIWYLYNRTYSEFAALGSRASLKTLGFAISETLDLIFDKGGVVHIGAIDKQAQRCYSYVKKFLLPHYEDLVQDTLMIRTTMINGNTLEVIPCTTNQVNGPHEAKVRFDEVELANPLAYTEAKGIPTSNHHTGEPPSICYTSTRKYVGGLFGKELERLRGQGKPVITFCYKDVSIKCPDSRSGKKPATVYVDRNTFQFSDHKKTKEMEPFQVFNKCLECPLVPTCIGDLKRSEGIVPIEDAILRFTSSTPEFWIAQGECRKPMKRGLMIYAFSEANKMKVDWGMFLDKRGNFDQKRWLFVGGKDFNWRPDATLFAMIDRISDDIYFFKEFNKQQMTIPLICREITEWCQNTPFGLPEDIQCDKSEPGLIETMRACKLPANAVEESDVEGGVDLLNYLCQPRVRAPMLHVDPQLCPTFVWEMEEGYKRKIDPRTGEPGDDPLEKDNHFVDSARYVVWKYLRQYSQPYGQYNTDQMRGMSIIDDVRSNLDTIGNVRRRDDNEAAIALMLAAR